jgi:CopG family nickel-responsive transcriptional regulator
MTGAMGITSVSLPEESLKDLARIEEAYGLRGRSEAVRASISAAIAEIKEAEDLQGDVEGVLVIVRRNHDDPWMIRLQARYEQAIKTQMHSHLRDRKCLEVMVLSCDASDLSSMMRDIRSEGKADYVKFVRSRRPWQHGWKCLPTHLYL